MGYGSKAILWVADSDSDFDSDGTSLTWRLDPAHFYIASLIFCLLAFVGYLISITVLVARQNSRRMTCLKIAGSLLAFELAVIAIVRIPPPPQHILNTHPTTTLTAPEHTRRYADTCGSRSAAEQAAARATREQRPATLWR
jgi:hypothetical protein